MSSVNHMREQQNAARHPMPSRVSVHEQQAQAAAIIGMAERLPDAPGREYIAARFAGITGREHVTSMMNRIF